GWRAVDHLAAQRLKLPDGLPQRHFLRVRLDLFIASRRADSDDRNAFSGRRDLFLQQRLGLRENIDRPREERRTESDSGFDDAATAQFHIASSFRGEDYLAKTTRNTSGPKAGL